MSSPFKKQGKIIEPNHNDLPFSFDQSMEIARRLVERINSTRNFVMSNPEKFLKPGMSWHNMLEEDKRKHINTVLLIKFRLYRKKIISLLLHCDREALNKENPRYLKTLIEKYWDDPDNFIDICSQ